MRKNIILHCVPPAEISIPSPALSILKASLVARGFNVTIIYWNLLLYDYQRDFLLSKDNELNNRYALLPYLNYIALKNNDKTLYCKVKQTLQAISPMHNDCSCDFYDKHLNESKIRLENIIENTIQDFDVLNALFSGFTFKLEQWFVASIIAEIIKAKKETMPIILGGLNTKECAYQIINNFIQFDIAMWGEGEYNLNAISLKLLNGDSNFSEISNISYRENKITQISNKRKVTFTDLSERDFFPIYDDYFEQHKIYTPNIKPLIPIEHSRGCHWNRCHFCYLNIGYKYRKKNINKLNIEIEHMLKRYQSNGFVFLDNDLIGNDVNHFELLLESFINIRKKNPSFNIFSAEIITKNLTRDLIKKMAIAGFRNVQIGYESTSNSLLQKMDKKNTFATNLHFIKFAFYYHINVTSLNVIFNLFEENENDIIEAIDNLKFLRFFRLNNLITHRLTPLAINSTSKYCQRKNIVIQKEQWLPNSPLYNFIGQNFNNDLTWNIFDFLKANRNDHWSVFEKIEQFYIKNKHSYKLFATKNHIKYIEYRSFKELFCKTFERNSIEFKILYNANSNVVSIDYLSKKLEINNIQKIIPAIHELNQLGLVYHNDDYSEILTIINTDLIIEISDDFD